MAIPVLDRIDRDIEIKAPPERVFRALTSRDELSAWFQVSIEGSLEAGSDVWMTSLLPEHRGLRFQVRIVEMTPPRRVVWQWYPGDLDAAVDYSTEPRTTVTFTLEPSGRGTRLRLSETGFDEISLARRAKVHADNSQGWTEVLVWLQRYVQDAH
jgi:uncharacterized protein YndB with AHSA1/START domain